MLQSSIPSIEGKMVRITLSVSFIFILFSIFITNEVLAQSKGGGGGGGTKDLVVRVCTEFIGNGLYNASFSYDNPNNKEVIVSEGNSYVRTSKGKFNGLNRFKKGTLERAFTRQFRDGERVEWTVINPNGKIHTVYASANSSLCANSDTGDGIIFPVYGQGNGKSNEIIGLELSSLAEGNAGEVPSRLIYQINNEKVLIEVVYLEGQLQESLNILTGVFGLQYSPNPQSTDFIINPAVIIANELPAIDTYFPIARLTELNAYFETINFVRPLYPAIQNTGITTTQGDTTQKSGLVRETFRTVINGEIVEVNGKGTTIGVLSDSYDNLPFTGKSKATVDVENGDLPGLNNPNGYTTEVAVLQEYTLGESSDEGRAMLQIIHDVAPGAALAFHSGTISPRSFELGVEALDAFGCDVMVDDITFLTAPFFGTSRVSALIQSFTSKEGNAYFSSAGNFSNTGYQGNFTRSSAVPRTNFIEPQSPVRAHVFGTNADGSQDVFQKISVVPGTYLIVLQWQENIASELNSTGADSDLDIFIVDDQGRLLVGNNRFNVNGDPTEIIVFQALGEGTANILITSADGSVPAGLPFRFVAFRSNGLEFTEYGGTPTVTGHAMTPSATTVAAVDYRSANTPTTQSFSSFGGALTDQTEILIDFAAPDGGNTNVATIGQDIDGDGFPNFFGTSAAAPHAAGAYALMLSALPSWYPEGLPVNAPLQSNQLADEALQLFKQTATPSGLIDQSGAGLIDVNKAFRSIAAPTSRIFTLVPEEGVTPSSEPFTVTIIGEFFPENPIILFDGKELEILSVTDTEIVAVVPAFSGNPALIVTTPGVTPGGTDGGASNPLYFFEDGIFAVNITANSITAEFGQAVEFGYTIAGLPEGSTLESEGLPPVVFTTPAVFPYPDVNNYVIFPQFENILSDELAANYVINFITGTLRITKKDLTVKMKDAAITYGDVILPEPEFIYNTTGIANIEEFNLLLNQAYQSTFFENNTIALINRFKPLVNELDVLSLLSEGSWMSTERSIQNRFKPLVNGLNVVELDIDHFTDYAAALQEAETNGFRFKALVNRFKALVNGVDLLSNNVDLIVENRIKPLVNSSTLGDPDDQNDYTQVFAIVDVDDTSTETEDRVISNFYSLNLITGIGVTFDESSRHYIFPGAFLAALAANFNVTYDYSRLTVAPATLQVTIDNILIQEDEILNPSMIVTSISGFVYDDVVTSVFPDGLTYTLIDEEGIAYISGATGVYSIKIEAPENYVLSYTNDAKLYINPTGTRKIKIFLDCVEPLTGDPDGYTYVANFRYDNPNDVTLYVLEGPDNFLSGTSVFSGELPEVFLPGQGTVQIRFDGNELKWNLTTLGSTNKTATSSSASSTSNRCDPYVDGSETAFRFYPNPIKNILTIEKNISSSTLIELYDSYGILRYSSSLSNSAPEILEVDMTSLPLGIYVLRCSTKDELFMYSLKKE
jgi:hypothetical protein